MYAIDIFVNTASTCTSDVVGDGIIYLLTPLGCLILLSMLIVRFLRLQQLGRPQLAFYEPADTGCA